MKLYKPDMTLVHGDTSTVVISLACYYKKSLAHVEAGLRTNNIFRLGPRKQTEKLQIYSLIFILRLFLVQKIH